MVNNFKWCAKCRAKVEHKNGICKICGGKVLIGGRPKGVKNKPKEIKGDIVPQ